MFDRTALVVLAVSLITPAAAEARSFRVNQLPFGGNFGCTSCHTSAAGGAGLTPFGSDAIRALVGGDLVQERDLDWAAIYSVDSDRDGYTNGEEVNDPMGTWTIGASNPIGGRVTNPGDRNDHPPQMCGDGRVTPPEECDGTNHNEFTCITLGLDDGVLVCNPDCSFDRSGCGDAPPDMGSTSSPTPDTPTPTNDDTACSTAPSRESRGSLELLVFALCGIIYRKRK